MIFITVGLSVFMTPVLCKVKLLIILNNDILKLFKHLLLIIPNNDILKLFKHLFVFNWCVDIKY